MRKRNIIMAVVLALLVGTSSYLYWQFNQPKVVALDLPEIRIRLAVGETVQITPEYTFDKELTQAQYDKAVAANPGTYMSDDTGIVTVDSSGYITAVATGKAYVFYIIGQNAEIVASLEIVVYE